MSAAPLQAAVSNLLHFQAHTRLQGLPQWDAQALSAELDTFAAWRAGLEAAPPWDGKQQAQWASVRSLLVQSAATQPRIAVRADGAVLGAAPAETVAGPITWGIAALLRGHNLAEDETTELDLVIRWWEGARRAGLPVEADFGECWRAFEWMGLQRHLAQLGRLATRPIAVPTQAQAGLAPGAHPLELPAADQPELLAAARKVALRYTPLKPLLRLLPPEPHALVGVGYTF